MAKLEESVKNMNIKKNKAKKRKHTATEHEDEVATKSLIVESAKIPEETTTAPAAPLAKNLKRKNKSKNNAKEKRAKRQSNEDDEDDDTANAADEDSEMHEPTAEELRESEKPENTKAVLTVRQKKKQKHMERLTAQKGQNVGKEKQRNVEYLQKWKAAQGDWKFEKLRQISIQLSMFEADKIEAHIWPTALEYLSGSKGAAKDKITKLAESVIDELDAKREKLEDEAERQAVVDSTRYQRARELLQSFD